MTTGLAGVVVLALLGVGGVGRAGSPGAGPAPAVSPVAGGTLTGRVTLEGAPPRRQKLTVVKDVAVCGRIDHLDDRVIVGEGGGLSNAVITIHGVKGGKGTGALGREFVLDQRSCAYTPHVLLVPAGAKVKILNSDGVMHNVHSFSRLNPPFNVAQPKTNRKIEETFRTPERIPVKCDVHGWMGAWIVVVPDAYSAVTDSKGRFSIDGIPPGRYSAVCWHEELGERSFEIEVGPGQAVERDIRFTAGGGKGK